MVKLNKIKNFDSSVTHSWGFPGGSDGKESAYNVGDLDLILGLGRPPGEGNGYPLQYSCLQNSMDRGAWQATVPGVAMSLTLLSTAQACITASTTVKDQ